MKINGEEISKKIQIDYDKFLIDPLEDIETPTSLLKISNTDVFTRGNISCISGAAKSRKTFLLTLLSAQFLEADEEHKVIYFDTEQAKFHAQKIMRRILHILGWSMEKTNRLRVYYLRELNTNERCEIIQKIIREKPADLIFIDGVRDLVKDFNNPVESSDIVNLLMNLSSTTNSHICSVLHVNKGLGNTELRGHVGTEIQNKSETVLTVEKTDETISCVKVKYTRAVEFPDFYFQINKNGIPEFCNPEILPKNTDKLFELFYNILKNDTSLTYSMLKLKVIGEISCSERHAERKINKAIENKIITKNYADKYYLTQNDEKINEYELPY